MSRSALTLAVVGGADIYAGIDRLADTLKEGDAWGVLVSCVILAWGGLAVTLAYAERRRTARKESSS